MEALEKGNDENTGSIETLTPEISDFEQRIADLEQAVAEATTQRQEDYAEWAEPVAANTAAQDVIALYVAPAGETRIDRGAANYAEHHCLKELLAPASQLERRMLLRAARDFRSLREERTGLRRKMHRLSLSSSWGRSPRSAQLMYSRSPIRRPPRQLLLLICRR